MKFAIYGYGNLGKAAERCARNFPDIELVGVFTRRDPATVTTFGAPVYAADELLAHAAEIDVLFIAGGSATDLPVLTPALAQHFNVIDSFDNHAHIADHFAAVDRAARTNGYAAMISVGWDPGMFSLARLYAESVLPDGATYTFWGKGVSQGHSDAIRRIPGVKDARQYTVPLEDALEAVRSGDRPDLNARSMHLRDCYVVPEDGADPDAIETAIRTMPDYFEGYETYVTFITEEELRRDHAGLPHGGSVIRTGSTPGGNNHTVEFGLTLDSNPEFTASVILAYARALYRLHEAGTTGCLTVFDVPPKYLSAADDATLRAHLL